MNFFLSAFLLAVAICLTGIASGGQVSAASQDKTKLKIYVVPLNCVLEKINDGINDISSLQPADCKKKIHSVSPPPFINPDGDITATPLPQYANGLDPTGSGEETTSELVIENSDLKVGGGTTIFNIFANGVTLVIQAAIAIFVIFLVGYVLLRRLFGFM